MQKIHHAKKSLGQNFLKSEQALKKIIEEGEIISSDIILEIGPGKGALTKKLLSAQNDLHNKTDKEKTGCVIAIEKDKNLIEFLQEKFSQEISDKKLILIDGDILEIDMEKILRHIVLRALGRSDGDGQRKFSVENFCGEQNNMSQDFFIKYKIIANIPYNITGAILKKFLTENNQPNMMVLMVQNEVAKRIVGSPRHGGASKKESILSISVKAYGTPKLAMKVPARYFSPAPKVDSAIISIKNISRKFFEENKINENNFWELIHTGFAHKRKKLSSNLKKTKENLNKEIFEQIKNKRAEDLSLTNWLDLIKTD